MAVAGVTPARQTGTTARWFCALYRQARAGLDHGGLGWSLAEVGAAVRYDGTPPRSADVFTTHVLDVLARLEREAS